LAILQRKTSPLFKIAKRSREVQIVQQHVLLLCTQALNLKFIYRQRRENWVFTQYPRNTFASTPSHHPAPHIIPPRRPQTLTLVLPLLAAASSRPVLSSSPASAPPPALLLRRGSRGPPREDTPEGARAVSTGDRSRPAAICGRVDPGEATPERRAGAAQRGLPASRARGADPAGAVAPERRAGAMLATHSRTATTRAREHGEATMVLSKTPVWRHPTPHPAP
jgi:hypothetical protein